MSPPGASAQRPDAHVRENPIARPIPFLNPTAALVSVEKTDSTKAEGAASLIKSDNTATTAPPGAQVEWRARDNRKGRHVLVVPRTHGKGDQPPVTSTWRAIAAGIWRMVTVFAWWDVSWWVGVLFSVGSAIFILSACFYWIPLEAPETEFPGESLTGGGVTSFIGATLFQIGAILLIVEAVNENQTGCFGWALEQALTHDHDEGSSDGEKAEGGHHQHMHKLLQRCTHHHAQHSLTLRNKVPDNLEHPAAGRRWKWWPTWHELRTHYWYEIGFQASFQLAIGATIFYVSGIMALPGIVNKLSTGALYGSFWLTYLVGGVLFIISSAFYILETQPNWYTPATHVLGWWIGVFNMIGSVGWTLSASFGYCSASWCEYQSDLSLLWASVAFTIGSLILWYEALDKYPVERARK